MNVWLLTIDEQQWLFSAHGPQTQISPWRRPADFTIRWLSLEIEIIFIFEKSSTRMDNRLKSKLFKCCHFSCRVSTSGRLKRPSPERENQSLNLQALHKWRYHSGSGLSSCRNAIYTVWVVLYENWILKVTLPEKSVWDWSFLNFFLRERICVSLTSGNYHPSLSGMCARHQTGVWRVPSCP